MGRATNKLSAKFVERKDLEPGLYGDGGGLYLQVSPRGDQREVTKAWVFRFMIQGRARKMGLGEVGRIRLADARKKAYAAYLRVKDGIDPIEERNARKAALATEKAKAMTFSDCAKGYIDAHQSGCQSGRARPRQQAGFAVVSRRFWTEPKCSSCGQAKTPHAGLGTLTSYCPNERRWLRWSITPLCPMPICLHSWRSCESATVSAPGRWNLQF